MEDNDNEEDAKRAKVEKEGVEGKEIAGEGSRWFVGKAPAESRMEEELDRDKKRLKVGRIGEYSNKCWVVGEDTNLGKVIDRWGLKKGKDEIKSGDLVIGTMDWRHKG